MLHYNEIVKQEILLRSRVVLPSVALLYLLFNILDHYVYPDFQSQFLLIRILVAMFLFLMLAFTFLEPVKKRIEIVSDVSMIVSGSGISLMIFLADGPISGYYQGLNLIMLATFTMNSNLVKHNLISGLAIISSYVLAVYFNGINGHYVEVTSAIFFTGTTLFFVGLMTKLYSVQHFKQFSSSEELKKTNEKLIEAERLKSDFFANVSHELRTPLTLILTPLESLLSGDYGSVPTEAQKILKIMHNNTVRLLQMVNGLLDFSKLESGKVEVKRAPVDVLSTTNMILSDFRPSIEKKKLSFTSNINLSKNIVSLDKYLYERILFNLLSNAIKYTSEGGEISFSLISEGDLLYVSVSDTGIGIAKEDKDKLFQKFKQLESSSTRRFEGTGLGLALVKEFSALLGGDVIVESEVGKGSKFTVKVLAPVAESQEILPEEEVSKTYIQKYTVEKDISQNSQLNEGCQPKVLVVEDNVELASYTSSLLQSFCEVEIAGNGQVALDIIAERKPDLILSDVMMPVMDGVTLCKELKKKEFTSSIPIVLLTALTHREAMLKGWESGADDYLFKPFHPQELITRIKSLLSINDEREKSKQLIKDKAEELRLMNEELYDKTKKLEESNRQLELFAYVASHDLRAPLRRINSFAEIIMESYSDKLDEKGQKCIQFMSESSMQMSKLTDDILQLSRVASRAQSLEKISLNEIVDDVLEHIEPDIRAKNAKIKTDKLPDLSVDRNQIYLLFQNLISNALKFSNDNPEILIFQAAPENGYAEISVKDNGVGFEMESDDKIFQMFERLHSSDKYEGSGLGLAICKKIVERHNGEIKAKSKVGEGATFTVKLPVIK